AQASVALAPAHFVLDEPLRVLTGQEAGVDVQYFSGARPLVGFGALQVTSDRVVATALPGDSLHITAGRYELRGTVHLSVGGEEIAAIAVEQVPESRVA